ncbi:MAG: endo-1,4-beta-xylanase [Bacteroidales bacterium]|nr:endo-1,4-beta-xylanase [Bacteroidales bacterium]
MKNTNLSYIIVAAMCLASCAEYEVADFDVEKPEEVISAEQLSSYGTLLDYVSPSFKIGNTLDMPTFTQQGTATTLTTHNFNEITLSGVFSHSKLVNEDGVVGSKIEDLDNAIRFAKEHNISVYGHSIVNSDVNSAYLNTKIVAEKSDIDVPMATAETIDLLGGANFEDAKMPQGWRCEQGNSEIHEYPNDYSGGGARTFVGFGGYHGKAIYWREVNAEYGAQAADPLTLTAGEYSLSFAMAGWKATPEYKVEIVDATGNVVVTSDPYTAEPNANGSKEADLTASELKELPFSIASDGNYTIRFTNHTGGFSEFLLLACEVNVLKPVEDYEYTDYLVNNFEDNQLPEGWRCEQGNSEIHEYPNDYSGGGARNFVGFEGYKGKAVYWREVKAEYGALADHPLTLAAGQYKLQFAMAGWKATPEYKVEIVDATGNSVVTSNAYVAEPNANGSKAADISSAVLQEFSFSISSAGNYIIRFINSTGGFSEFLLLDCKLGAIKNNGAVSYEPVYSDATKQTAEAELKKYVTSVIADNPDVTAWTVVENSVSSKNVIWYKVLGESYINSAFKYARAASSSAKLFVSEAGLEDADTRAALINFVKTTPEVDGINVVVAVKEETDLSSVLSDLAATGKSIRLNILSVADAASLSKALAAYKQIPEAQRYGITFASTLGIWDENYNRTDAFAVLADALK